MLVIQPKRDEKIVLRDLVSGAVVTIVSFRRNDGNLNLGIEAPQTVRIIKEKRNAEYGPNTGRARAR